MRTPPVITTLEWLLLGLVIALAALTRFGYLWLATDAAQSPAPLHVQDGRFTAPDTAAADDSFAKLVQALAAEAAFYGPAPLHDGPEPTAHIAPGYAYVVAQFQAFAWQPETALRWTQAGLGVLTVVCVFLLVRRAFFNSVAAVLAGLLAALHPFWILNAAEVDDGTLATFLLVAALLLGTRGSQAGGAFTSLLFGLTLAALAMVRAALLPFTALALLWYLAQCGRLRTGWFFGVLAFLGFANGLAPWGLRNYRQFDEIVPVADSAYLHLWAGNNPQATGGPLDEATLRDSLPPERLAELLAEENQARRYALLGRDLVNEVASDPAQAFVRRWAAGIRFLLGDYWFEERRLSAEAGSASAAPAWLTEHAEVVLQAALLGLVLLALLGWRSSFAWRGQARLLTLAAVWIPIPYLVSHAAALSGPRLPWDACLIAFAAYALASLAAGTRQSSEEAA